MAKQLFLGQMCSNDDAAQIISSQSAHEWQRVLAGRQHHRIGPLGNEVLQACETMASWARAHALMYAASIASQSACPYCWYAAGPARINHSARGAVRRITWRVRFGVSGRNCRNWVRSLMSTTMSRPLHATRTVFCCCKYACESKVVKILTTHRAVGCLQGCDHARRVRHVRPVIIAPQPVHLGWRGRVKCSCACCERAFRGLYQRRLRRRWR